jgi:hypothetical protein
MVRSIRPKEVVEDYDIELDLEIDPQYIDVEFMNHAIIHTKYAKLAAEANKIAKEAEEKVKVIRSELVNQANEDPDRYLGKGVKPIAATVEAYYRTHSKHKAAKEEYIEASYHADLLGNYMFAIQARKSALETLARLMLSELYSAPQEPRDLPEAVEKYNRLKAKAANNKIKERLNRR